MSLIKLVNGKTVDTFEVITKFDSNAAVIITALSVLVLYLTIPLWLAPIVGISILQGYFFLLAQVLFSTAVNSFVKVRALLLISRKGLNNGN